jgi:adenylylsulfate kinase
MKIQNGFVVWITGIPASGKTSITRELVKKLEEREVLTVVLESDEMRKILTPEPTYAPEERDQFYKALSLIGEVITRSGVNVVFDATANKQAYRDFARSLIPNFIEAYVRCPLEVSMKRDPKGIYRSAAAGQTATVPGMQVPYEPPENPEVTLDGQSPPETSAEAIMDTLKRRRYISYE